MTIICECARAPRNINHIFSLITAINNTAAAERVRARAMTNQHGTTDGCCIYKPHIFHIQYIYIWHYAWISAPRTQHRIYWHIREKHSAKWKTACDIADWNLCCAKYTQWHIARGDAAWINARRAVMSSDWRRRKKERRKNISTRRANKILYSNTKKKRFYFLNYAHEKPWCAARDALRSEHIFCFFLRSSTTYTKGTHARPIKSELLFQYICMYVV